MDRRNDLPPASPAQDAAPRPATGSRFRTPLAWLLVLAMISAVFGYQVGKDLAERDNRAGCAASGECGRPLSTR